MYRYDNQQQVDIVGEAGQKKLASSHVLIVGLGGLGSVVAPYLAGAGIGQLTVCDFDAVETSNLHRQIIHREYAVGMSKVESTIFQLNGLNSSLEYQGITEDIREVDLEVPDLVVDCTDNKETKIWLDAYAKDNGIPLVSAGVGVYQAQLYNIFSDSLIRLPELLKTAENSDKHIVLGPVCGVVGSLQALMVLYDLLAVETTSSFSIINLRSYQIQRLSL